MESTYCTQYPELMKYVNLCDYSLADIVLIAIGTILWLVAYGVIIRNSLKYKFVEMPVVAASANIAWEFAWGFLLVTNLGKAFVWGLQAWFLFDVFIFIQVLRYGHKQWKSGFFTKHFRLLVILATLVWVPVFYYMCKDGHDQPMGTTSAYFITVPMAVLYLSSFIDGPNARYYSLTVAWAKGLGNAFMTVFTLLHYQQLNEIKIMALAVCVFDLSYFIKVWQYRRRQGPAIAAA